MADETRFAKYADRGAYHWEQVSRSIRHHNAYVCARYDAVLSALGDVKGQLVLDLGGGDGALSYLIAQRGARVVTLDSSVDALRHAREQFRLRSGQASAVGAVAYSLPFPDAVFDAIVCSDVIEHVQRPDLLVGEALRTLRLGERIVLTTPLRVTERPLDGMHVHEFYPSELGDVLGACGDVVVREFAPLALLELYVLPFRHLGGRPLFRYLFNAASTYLNCNPFATQRPFRYQSMLLATGVRT